MIGGGVVCIVHGEDADGLTCAALLKRLFDTTPVLTTYDDLLSVLEGVSPPVKELYICDLNIRESLVPEIIRIRGVSRVAVIDHHQMEEGVLEALEGADVEVVYDTRDSASVLLFDHFRERLGREAGRLAAYTAWSDQFEDGPIATELLWDYDRQLVQHEAMILTHAITRMQNESFWKRIVEGLSKLDFPHEIQGVVEASLAHVEEMVEIIKALPGEAVRRGRLASIRASDEEPIGTIANLLLDSLGAEVGLCYKVKDGGRANISMRSRRGLTFHLGEITRRLAAEHGGFGGGHKRASGASIPEEGLEGFIRGLEEILT
jgi:oligoribonuclease NrnB/cAMP/cGMP phosphodiesterase (DHH superfamily)